MREITILAFGVGGAFLGPGMGLIREGLSVGPFFRGTTMIWGGEVSFWRYSGEGANHSTGLSVGVCFVFLSGS